MRFKDKVAIVTGAGNGIGETYAKRLAQEGAKVVVAEIKDEWGERVAQDIKNEGGTAIFTHVDVSDPASADAMAQTVIKEFGGIDILVNNAAIFQGMESHPLTEVPWDYYKRFMSVNMDGCLIVTRACYKSMAERGGGAIVNQSSTAAYMGAGYYGIAKLGLNGITVSLAMELGPMNIRVNGVAPGPTDTPAMREVPKEVIDGIVSQLPLGRLGQTDDQANAVMFLLSDDASWITGQILCVDGGQMKRA